MKLEVMVISTAKYIKSLMIGSFILLLALFFLSISYDLRTAAFVKIGTVLLGLIILFSFVYSYGVVRIPLSLDVPGLLSLTPEQKSFKETVEERIEREKIRTERLKEMHREQKEKAEKIAEQPKKITEQKTEAPKAAVLKASLPPLPPLELDEKESFAEEVPSKRRDVLNRLKDVHDINFFTEQKDNTQSYFTNVFDKKIVN